MRHADPHGCARHLTVVGELRRTARAGRPGNKLVSGPENQLSDIAQADDQRTGNVHGRQLLRNCRVRKMAKRAAMSAVIVGVVGRESGGLGKYETAKSEYG